MSMTSTRNNNVSIFVYFVDTYSGPGPREYDIEDHFAGFSKMIETKQRKRLGNAETPAKKKSEDK
ncbi:MAG: hypothetical protein WC405_01785 [Syntrophales bacterium]